MILYSEEELVEAFEALEDQNVDVMSAVTEVQMVVASYKPLTWQVNVKVRDRGLAWGTGVADNPGDAFVRAYKAAVGLAKGSAYFYPKKELAEKFATKIGSKFKDSIGYVKVEFEPYRGFVVVVSPKAGRAKALRELAGKVELRDGSSSRPQASPKEQTLDPRGSSRREDAAKKPVQVPAGSMPDKGTMDTLWKSKKGKFPPREWKKAELWDRIKKEGYA